MLPKKYLHAIIVLFAICGIFLIVICFISIFILCTLRTRHSTLYDLQLGEHSRPQDPLHEGGLQYQQHTHQERRDSAAHV